MFDVLDRCRADRARKLRRAGRLQGLLMLLGLAALCTSPPARAQACGFAPIYTNTGSGVTDVPTNAEQLQSWSPTGTLLSTVPLANNYGDIALDPTGSVLYAIGFSFNEPYARRLYRIDPATGAELSFVSLTGDIVTDNVVVLNSLGFRGDGTLLVGGAFVSAIYVIDPVTGSTSRFGASFPANVTAAGDFVTLPDGDLLASGRDNTGGAYYLYRMRADGSVFPIGEVPSTFGAAMSRGTVYLIGEAGQIHRVDALPSLATTAPLPITTIVDSGQSFYGATSAQDAGSRCDPAALTLRKTWVNAAVNDAVVIQATVDATVVDTLSSTADTTDETDTDATPITVYGGDVITFSETFAVGDPGQYGGSLTCTGNQAAVSGMTLTVANADTDIVCTYVNARPSVTYSKSASTTGPVAVGDTITYTLTTVVADSQTTSVTTLTDTLGTGLTFGAVTNAGAYTCNSTNPLVCTLPVGTVPGTYTVTYTATVNDQAVGTVDNAVVGTGEDAPTCAGTCTTQTPVAAPRVVVSKSSDPGTGAQVQVGQTVRYTLTMEISASALREALVLVDTPDRGLTLGALPAGCTFDGTRLTCQLPAGTPAGVHTLTYEAVVNPNAGPVVGNQVSATGGGGELPTCTTCSTEHELEAPQIRLSKTAGSREVRIGDLVRYTLTVENVGRVNVVNGSVVDTPAAGFSYVEGSLLANDADAMATVSGGNPLRFSGVDVAAGETATLVYVMRVGAGVRPGTHVNQAQVRSATDDPVSNVATAEVVLTADPLLDDSLVFGTVFNDRDGDGWQDSAALSGVKVQGGFAPTAYIANSTTVDRGAGPQPEPDASSPLLHGIAVGAISGRQSVADPVQDHEVVIRQRLNELSFTDDFVLTSNQGVTVRMDAAGNTRVEQSGEAAKGLTAAAPTVERRVAQSEGGYVVDYVIRNTGIDERGIPGVRIASVEGLLIETDQYGRYHLAGVSGGAWERGRNFILKVDPSTLPAGAQFTTDNPLLRRVTPGVPVRFDWGVKLPEQVIEGGTEQVELEMGEVFFAPGSAEVREKYLPVIEAMAAKVRQYQGGEVVIQANGDSQGLAFERANAVKAALLDKLDAASARGLVVSARGSVDDPSSMIVGVDEGGALLGTVLFDTDKSNIRPEFAPLLDKVAAALEKMGGGSIAIVGHTDVRASHAYNLALGMRRAKAVYEALAQRLSPQVRANVRVEASNDPTAPVGVRK
jgi:uncharacterized repeat protein (TIGR01451 family)/fimbrial isopeptide formation D2 family protein